MKSIKNASVNIDPRTRAILPSLFLFFQLNCPFMNSIDHSKKDFPFDYSFLLSNLNLSPKLMDPLPIEFKPPPLLRSGLGGSVSKFSLYAECDRYESILGY